MKKFALISVFDKTGILEFARKINGLGYHLLATGKTGELLKAKGLDVTEIKDYTGYEEILDGRVKTLHPKIFGGILNNRNDDAETINKYGLDNIEIVCVNLYPFEAVVSVAGVSEDEVIENIDVGGVSLIRASAKNYKHVNIITHHSQYNRFVSALEKGENDEIYRKKLAVEAFKLTSSYDLLISKVFSSRGGKIDEVFTDYKELTETLRYGENPHQQAFLFGDFYSYFEKIHGKELSYNNITDLIAGAELVSEFTDPAATIIKHTNPAGVACGFTIHEAYLKALESDPVSAFGGIVCFNRQVDVETAKTLNEIFLELIVAPGYNPDALEILKTKKQRRLIISRKSMSDVKFNVRSVPGGYLMQTRDMSKADIKLSQNVTIFKPVNSEVIDLEFAWQVAKHVKSNSIVFAKNRQTVGIGAGQVSRIDSVKIAGFKAEKFGFDLKGAVAASDAFFPFEDNIKELQKLGISAIAQPGGSVRDSEVIKAADEAGISMIFTGIRHFKH
ncbi:MAG: bifunctional phosphoribosylaminoimidazolecarboxamide formyltransferase/IMP cyclohydrolase [Ignavibacteriaceae bacterium]|nr:bifunctional phosphoribosylaminoimidazolecarboxamide formyltransferase/IMP cyclohydrolase [Ignavibacteriaceae bacterium]